MSYQEALKIIEKTKESNSTELDLSNLDLKEIPKEIFELTSLMNLYLADNLITKIPRKVFKLTNLTTLDLSSNKITQIPKEIENLTNLTMLSLFDNQITQIPREVFKLTNLTTLDLGSHKLYLRGNKITQIPKEIGNLTNLTTLGLSNNQITQIPREIGNLTSLTELSLFDNKITQIPREVGNLTSLTELSLFDNKITQIPREIGNLTNLKGLDLSHNKITQIPREIGNLTNLKGLDLSHNEITQIPKEIGELTNLATLSLSNNQITQIPNELGKLVAMIELFLRKNRLTKLSSYIGKLRKLEKLNVSENELTSLPKELGQLVKLVTLKISDNRIKTIPVALLHLKKLTEFNFENNEIPYKNSELQNLSAQNVIRFIQELQRGKNRKLNEAKVLFVGVPNAGKTSLIDMIKNQKFDENKAKTDGIKINKVKFVYKKEKKNMYLWDFGGQEIMHSTHQFFFSDRSIYVLVLDGRAEHGRDNIQYWLELITALGGNSPIFIVMNKIDENPTYDLNRREYQQKYKNIKGFYKLSCKKRDNRDINIFINDLKKSFLKLPHTNDVFPIDWLRAKTHLEKLKEQNIRSISSGYFIKLCNNLYIQNEDIALLRKILHDLGIILSFEDNPILRDVGILNPNWAIDGIYKIIDNRVTAERFGLLELKDIDNILNRFSRNVRIQLIEIMIKFELCFKVENRYLIVGAMSKNDKIEQVSFNQSETLKFRYNYTSLPQSIILRFIVKTHHLIEDIEFLWRNGTRVIKEGIRANIIADEGSRNIDIEIEQRGDRAKDVLVVIRNYFDEIHKTMTSLEFTEEIFLPDKPEIGVNYKVLQKMKDKAIKSFLPNENCEVYNVDEVLGSIEKEEKKMGDTYNFDNVKNLNFNKDSKNVKQSVKIYKKDDKKLENAINTLITQVNQNQIENSKEIIENLKNLKNDKKGLSDYLVTLLTAGGSIGSIAGGIGAVLQMLK